MPLDQMEDGSEDRGGERFQSFCPSGWEPRTVLLREAGLPGRDGQDVGLGRVKCEGAWSHPRAEVGRAA